MNLLEIMTSQISEQEFRITRGSGNVFADLGFADAGERQAKLRLAHVVNQLLDARKLSPSAVARTLKLTESRVFALRRYKLAEFSVDTLIGLLTALDQDVEIVIRRKPYSRTAGRITVRPPTDARCHERV